MRHRRARHSGGPLGCLHAVIGFVACVGFVVGAFHVATDPPASRAATETRPSATASAQPHATARPRASQRATPTVRPRATQRAASETAAECLEGIGLDPYEVAIEGTDPAEYGC